MPRDSRLYRINVDSNALYRCRQAPREVCVSSVVTSWLVGARSGAPFSASTDACPPSRPFVPAKCQFLVVECEGQGKSDDSLRWYYPEIKFSRMISARPAARRMDERASQAPAHALFFTLYLTLNASIT